MAYHQITREERYTISAMRKQGWHPARIARELGRHRSTIGRELARNASRRDGSYRAARAQEMTNRRRSWSRKNRRFGETEWALVEALIRQDWSPEQISGYLARTGILSISHETIYRYILEDKYRAGTLHQHLRHRSRKRRKRYGTYERRGRLEGKRHISQRPAYVEKRRSIGHWEIDTLMGVGNDHCVLTLVERASGFLLMRKLRARNKAETARRTLELVRSQPGKVKTITADNGSEFHSYEKVENATDAKYYFATPHHAWERGTSENTNGLVRQYLPKRTSMQDVTQIDCRRIADWINARPRKRLGFRSPAEVFNTRRPVLRF
jgi:IS30 family transposase